eukprot:4523158-Pyramimonas_sp.AAC.1
MPDLNLGGSIGWAQAAPVWTDRLHDAQSVFAASLSSPRPAVHSAASRRRGLGRSCRVLATAPHASQAERERARAREGELIVLLRTCFYWSN